MVILWSLSVTCSPLLAQQGRAENSDGNSFYERGLYQEALSKYQEALRKNPESPIIKFNSGNAQYKVKAFDEALEAFRATSSKAEDQRLRAQSYYNLGNTQYRKGSLQDAVESYKQALRLDPNDIDAKYNLEYVLKELKENPPQESQQQNENQQDQQQEENQDDQQQKDGDQQQEEQPEEQQQEPQDEQSQGNSDAGQEQDQQQQQDSSDSRDQQEEPQGRQNENQQQQEESAKKEDPQSNADISEAAPMTREQAEQILQALREDQADFLRKRTVKRKPAVAGKDW
jgi:tetratricopeptide (TPR) repeat protein